MKTLRYVTVAVLVWGVLSGDGRADEKREEKPRMKGVELSRWKDDEGDWMSQQRQPVRRRWEPLCASA